MTNKSTKFLRLIKNLIIISSILYPFSNFLFAQRVRYKSYISNNKDKLIAEIKWKTVDKYFSENKVIWNEKINEENSNKLIKWEKLRNNNFDKNHNQKKVISKKNPLINSLNRSLVFDNEIIGPDISWLVPPGFKWNSKYKFDSSVRGHNRRQKNEPFLGWNNGDAVGQQHLQLINNEQSSIGINIGIRSMKGGSNISSGSSSFGEGTSAGFRIDRKLSDDSGIAFGAEQLLHFDGLTDTGRDIYLTISKGWWSDINENGFPLDIATIGLGTGKMAEGNVKGFCSDLLGGSGTEINHQRNLCWSPIFALSRVYNHKLSTFFEYNSKWFLLGSSISPFETIPLRGTFAIQLSDHINNYKPNNFNELKWVFRLSLGF